MTKASGPSPRDWRTKADWNAAAFLERLNETLFARTDRHIRPQGAAQSAGQTLATAKGRLPRSCGAVHGGVP